MTAGAFTGHSGIASSILGFAAYARANNFNIGLREIQDALTAADAGVLTDKPSFFFTLKAIFCTSETDIAKFEKLFLEYWKTDRGKDEENLEVKRQVAGSRRTERSQVLLGNEKSDKRAHDDESATDVTGANKEERLRKTDFSVVGEIDSAHLEKLALHLWRQMGKRLRRKMKNSTSRGVLDIRQTIRNSISSGGSMLELNFKDKKPEKYRLVILLDVSGSMDKYSFYLLRFILALREHFQNIEAFVFSTRLVRITDYLRIRNLHEVLGHLSQGTEHWSSGTKIGACLHSFNMLYAKRVLNGRTMTLILSDGLDTGEPSLLAGELQKIKRRSRRIIWLNPLKGHANYQPLARGMKAALPSIDVFRAANNLESLLELERYLAE